jgi:hypothetical protein
VRSLLAAGGGLIALLLIPLALSPQTAWVLLPAHLLLTVLATIGAVAEGSAGWPARARMWGAAYVVATAAMVAALSLGANARGSGMLYWGAPWLAALLWGWIPPIASGLSGWMGEARRRQRNRSALRQRRAARSAPP